MAVEDAERDGEAEPPAAEIDPAASRPTQRRERAHQRSRALIAQVKATRWDRGMKLGRVVVGVLAAGLLFGLVRPITEAGVRHCFLLCGVAVPWWSWLHGGRGALLLGRRALRHSSPDPGPAVPDRSDNGYALPAVLLVGWVWMLGGFEELGELPESAPENWLGFLTPALILAMAADSFRSPRGITVRRHVEREQIDAFISRGAAILRRHREDANDLDAATELLVLEGVPGSARSAAGRRHLLRISNSHTDSDCRRVATLLLSSSGVRDPAHPSFKLAR